MITLIAGRPGSGKTYEAVKYHILPAIQEGRKVITNVPINKEYVSKVLGADVAENCEVVDFDFSDFDSGAAVFPFSRPSHYSDEWRDENGRGALYVIDEAHFAIPNGGTFPDVKKFYTMHRHYGVDILLMTQNPRQLDKDICNLIEIVYKCTKQTSMGSSKTYVKKVQDGMRGDIVNTSIRKYDKTVFPFYKSHTQSNKSVLEASAKDIKPFWKRWPVVGTVVLLPLGIIILLSAESPMDVATKGAVDVQNKGSVEVPLAVQASASAKPPSPVNNQPVSDKSQVSRYLEKHPYHAVQLHITASYYTDPSKRDYVMMFGASRNGQMMFEIYDSDLVRAGYDVFVLNDCSAVIQWAEHQQFVTCDYPSVSMVMPI